MTLRAASRTATGRSGTSVFCSVESPRRLHHRFDQHRGSFGTVRLRPRRSAYRLTSADEPEWRSANPRADAWGWCRHRVACGVRQPPTVGQAAGAAREWTDRALHPPGTEVAPTAWQGALRSALALRVSGTTSRESRSAGSSTGWSVLTPTARSSGHPPISRLTDLPGRYSEEAPSGVAPDGTSSHAGGERASTAGPGRCQPVGVPGVRPDTSTSSGRVGETCPSG